MRTQPGLPPASKSKGSFFMQFDLIPEISAKNTPFKLKYTFKKKNDYSQSKSLLPDQMKPLQGIQE